MCWNSNRGFCNVHSTSASIQIWRQAIKLCTGHRFIWFRQKNIQSQVFKHEYSLSRYSERKEKKGRKCAWERGKNIWSLFASLGLRFVSKTNPISYLKMKHTQQSWERKQNPLMCLSWGFAALQHLWLHCDYVVQCCVLIGDVKPCSTGSITMSCALCICSPSQPVLSGVPQCWLR